MPRAALIGTRGYPSYYGGFETLYRNLVPYLAGDGWSVDAYCRDGSVEPLVSREPRVNQIFTPGIERKSLSTLSYGFTSTVHASWRRPDVALVMNVANGYWLPFLKARGIPSIVNVDGIEWERDKWGQGARRVFQGGATMTAKFANELVYDADAISSYWVERFGRSGTVIPYGGVEQDRNLPRHPSVPEYPYVLYVARFVPENSIEEFLDAVALLNPEVGVVIVGSSGYRDQIESRVEELARGRERVSWLGHVSNDELLFSLWQHCAVYFHGHSVGGTNPALVQAMACGAPTVARDTVFNREVLGECGLFVSPDPVVMADSLVSLWNDRGRQSQMRESSMLRQNDFYSWDMVCGRYLALMKQLL